MSIRGETEDTTRKENVLDKKKRGRTIIPKSKGVSKKKAEIDEIKLGGSEGEEKILIKWQDYKIETLIAIRDEIKEKFKKSLKNNL